MDARWNIFNLRGNEFYLGKASVPNNQVFLGGGARRGQFLMTVF